MPFLWIGDTAWPLLVEYPLVDAERYLRHRGRTGFTVIQCVLAWGKGSGYEMSAPLPNPDGEVPWRGGNPARPDPAFFAHVDTVLGIAAEEGLTLAILPTWGYYVNQTRTVNVRNARDYGRWLGRRFGRSRNLVWVNGGDRIATGFERVYDALGRGLKEGSGGRHLVTYHPCGCHSSSEWFHAAPWLDFNMIQTWTDWHKVHPMVMADVARAPRKPVILAEGAYENGPEYPLGPITPLLVRRQAWWAFLAGGFPTYGQNQMWRMEPGWASTFDTPGARHMGVMRRFLGRLRWWELIPDQSLLAAGAGERRTLNAAALAENRRWGLVYLSGQCSVSVELVRFDAKAVRATFVDPRTGATRDAGIHATGNDSKGVFPAAQTASFTTPGYWEDALLLLEAAEKKP